MGIIKRLLRIGVLAVGLVAGSYLVLNSAQYHRSYLRSKVGPEVLMLVGTQGGGTGFSIKTPKGKTYTLTNRHICEIADNGVLYADPDLLPIPVRVLKISKKADLCLVENVPNKKGLSLSDDSLQPGDEFAIVGHPMLLPLTLSRGELIGYQQIEMPTKINEECGADEKEVFTLFFSVCLKSYRAGMTNAVALGGNSGSPVVNFWGEVVGVLFAGFNDSNWGIIVPLEEIKEFLKDY